MINWQAIRTSLEQSAPKILGALVIFIVGMVLIRRVTRWAEKYFSAKQTDQTRLRFLMTFIRFSLTIVLVLTLLEYIGSFTTTVTTIVGAITLSVGLALQGAFQNLAGGILIVSGRPFRLGDYIEVIDFAGTVEEIGILTTILRTADNKKLILPNGKVSNDFITHYTAYDLRRVDVPVRFETITDLESAKQTLLELAKLDPAVVDSPIPEIHPVATDDYRSALMLKVWVKTSDYWPTYWRLLEASKKMAQTQAVGSTIPTMNIILQQPDKRPEDV